VTKKKMFGGLAMIGLGLIPGAGSLVSAAKLGGELVVGELLLKEDEEKEKYRGWYRLAAHLRDNETLSNSRRKALLLGRIESDLVGETGQEPGETDLMFYFYMVVRDVKGGFEVESEGE